MNQIDYTTTSPRFSVTDNKQLDEGFTYLNAHGYVVISDVMSQDEVNMNKELLWKFIESVSNSTIKRDDPETWPSFSSHGVINGLGIGQSEFLWSVRSNRQVKNIFARLWNTRQLLVSFDGCGVYRDWRYNSTWKTNDSWDHVDQNPKLKPDRCCIQGIVSLTDQNQRISGLIVYPRTHLRFTELWDITKNSRDFVQVSSDHAITLVKLLDRHHIHRMIQAIDDQTLDEFREKRKQLVKNNCTTTHWSTELVLSLGNHTDPPKLSLDRFDAYQKALIFGTDDENDFCLP
ncbi:unnamed protein product [Rotaria socialis]